MPRKKPATSYELAARRMLNLEDRPSPTSQSPSIEDAVPGSERLVHGTIQGHPRAWVTYDVALGDMGANGGKFDYGNITMVWEPVADEYYPWVYSQNAYNAVEHHAYTMDEARQRFADSGHYGPWGEGGTR